LTGLVSRMSDQPARPDMAARLSMLVRLSVRPEIDGGYLELASEAIAQCALDAVQCSRASVWVLSEDQRALRCVALLVRGQRRHVENLQVRAQDFPRHFEALLSEKAIRATDAATHPAMAEFQDIFLKYRDIRSVFVYPVHARGRLAGGIYCAESGMQREWDDEDEVFLYNLAELTARAFLAVERNEVEDKLILAKTHLERVVEERTTRLRQALEDLQFAQKQLVENEKMAALGSLVAGVAHEINTPIGIGITALSHLIDEEREMSQKYAEGKIARADFEVFIGTVHEGADIALRNLKRAAELITSFRRVAAHQSDEQIVRFDLVQAVGDVIKSVGPEIRKKGLEIKLDAPAPVPVLTYIGAIEQVLTNLLINAVRHAYDKRKSGIIRVAVETLNGYAQLVVQDDGDGIAPDLLPRVFEPFVTTKREDGGTGLGLAITYNLVAQQLKGRITVDSELGRGSRFWVAIPVDLLALTGRVVLDNKRSAV
jgi:two-component system, NtrC family, sensor kinase